VYEALRPSSRFPGVYSFFFFLKEYVPVVCPPTGSDVLEPLVALRCLRSNDLVNFEDLEQLKVLGAGFPIAIAQVFLFL
jgi:hypothetical protein